MPRVGDEEFAYTPEGKAAAKQKSLETGEPVIKRYDAGGRVKKMRGYVHGGPVREDVADLKPTIRSENNFSRPIQTYDAGGRVKVEHTGNGKTGYNKLDDDDNAKKAKSYKKTVTNVERVDAGMEITEGGKKKVTGVYSVDASKVGGKSGEKRYYKGTGTHSNPTFATSRAQRDAINKMSYEPSDSLAYDKYKHLVKPKAKGKK